MTTAQDLSKHGTGSILSPEEILHEALEALIKTSESSFPELEFEPIGDPAHFSPEHVEYGSCISLARPQGSWNLAVVATEDTCKKMARALLCMEPDEEVGNEELADAMGEIINIVAGVFKTRLAEREKQVIPISLGLPLFLVGAECLEYTAKGIRLISQKIAGPGVQGQIVFFWKEGKSVA